MNSIKKNIKNFNIAVQLYLLYGVLVCATAFLPSIALCYTSVSVLCSPVIKASHLTKSCLEQDLENISYPSVDALCGDVTGLSYEDIYYKLAQHSNFTAYFELSRWEKKSGDGGVDVTGAPNCILVEGANTAQVTVAPGRTVILRIAIPARGYATFDWKNIGGSNLLFSTIVNDKVYPITNTGFYRSPLLRAGDSFTIQMENASKNHLGVQVSDFQFITNATSIIERKWTATDDKGNVAQATQFIAIEPLSLDQVIFPENLDGQSAPLLQTNESKEPNFTGFPVFDADGNALTMHDQAAIPNCAFSVEWKDEFQIKDLNYVLLRHWLVSDANGNVREHTQLIRPQSISVFNLKSEILPQQPSAKVNENKTPSISNDSSYKLTVSGFTSTQSSNLSIAAIQTNNANLQ
ncbi:MAG: hypothetical protein SFU99_18200 [Saprospiraceae bacterium]|nr:hypothetical protein [Saprospiraceae bacterium]